MSILTRQAVIDRGFIPITNSFTHNGEQHEYETFYKDSWQLWSLREGTRDQEMYRGFAVLFHPEHFYCRCKIDGDKLGYTIETPEEIDEAFQQAAEYPTYEWF